MLVKLRISDRKCLIFCYFSEAPPPLFKISGSAPDIPKLKPPLYSFTALFKKMIWISLAFRKAAMYQTPKSTTYPMQIWIGGLDIRKHSFLSRYFMSIGDHSFKKNTCHFCVVDKYNLSMIFFLLGWIPPWKKIWIRACASPIQGLGASTWTFVSMRRGGGYTFKMRYFNLIFAATTKNE